MIARLRRRAWGTHFGGTPGGEALFGWGNLRGWWVGSAAYECEWSECGGEGVDGAD
jgi:hypothetical protein